MPAWCTCSALLRPLTGLPDFPRNWDLICLPAPQPPPSTCRGVLCARGWSCARLLPMDGAEKHRAVSCGAAAVQAGALGVPALLRLGLGGLLVGQERGSCSCLTSSHSRKCRVGLGWLQSLHWVCVGWMLMAQLLAEAPAGADAVCAALCCSRSLRGVPCLPSSTASAASPPQHRGC